MVTYRLRRGEVSDLPCLRAMLFEAAYWRSPHERPSLEVGLSHPDLADLPKILGLKPRPSRTAF
jgi:hypothetical protein